MLKRCNCCTGFFFLSWNYMYTNANLAAAARRGTPRWSLLSWTRELRWDFSLPTVVFPWLLRSSVHERVYDRVDRETREDTGLREARANRLSVEPAKVARTPRTWHRVLCSAIGPFDAYMLTCSHVAAVMLSAITFNMRNVPWSRQQMFSLESTRSSDLKIFLSGKAARGFNRDLSFFLQLHV